MYDSMKVLQCHPTYLCVSFFAHLLDQDLKLLLILYVCTVRSMRDCDLFKRKLGPTQCYRDDISIPWYYELPTIISHLSIHLGGGMLWPSAYQSIL